MKTFYSITTAMLTRSVSCMILLACLLLSGNVLYATTYTVNNTTDGHGTNQFRGALENAALTAGPHTINVAAGTYNLSLGEITLGDVLNQSITIAGAGAASTNIHMVTGTGNDRILFINTTGATSGVTTIISGLTFSNGHLDTDPFGGGAIRAGGPNNVFTVTNCVFSGNTFTSNGGTTGGAINISGGGTTTISNCTFSGNSNPAGDGGALYFFLGPTNGSQGTFNVSDCIFSSNSSSFNGGAIGIGVGGSNTFTCNILRNVFTSNSSASGNGGGAIVVNNGAAVGNTANINYNRFVGNTATSNAIRSAVAIQNAQGNVNLSNNWWGCNLGYGVSGCGDKAATVGSGGGTNTFDPYLQLKTTATSSTICSGTTTTISTGFTSNSTSQAITAANLTALVGATVTYNTAGGSLSSQQTTIQSNGLATATFTPTANTTNGNTSGSVNPVVDNVTTTDATAKVTLTIQPATTITSSPGTSTVCSGTTASLSVAATGSGTLTYQWRRGTTNLSNGATGTGSTIAGATSTTLSISNPGTSDAGTDYNVIVTGGCGPITSFNGTVAVTQIGTWTGNVNTNWAVSGNWSCSTVPTSTTDVTIPVTGNPPVLNGSGNCNNITINSGATLTLSTGATLDIKGNMTVNGTYIGLSTNSTTVFSGGAQSFPGLTYYNLQLTGAGSKTLTGSAATVTGALTLTAGTLSLGTNNLTINTGASISGGSSSSYIVTNGTGGLVQQNIGTSGRTGAILFPVGSSTTSYTPVTLTNTGTADNFTARILSSLSSAYNASDVPTGTTQSTNAVGRTWLLSEATTGGSNVTATFQWNTADELTGFSRANSFVSHYTGGAWDQRTLAGPAQGSNPYTRSLAGITSFSPFGIGSGGSPLPLELLSFTGTATGKNNLLNWKTTAEKNTASFDVEKSVDANQFSQIANVTATGNGKTGENNYSFTDQEVAGGMSYYRLRIVDLNGTATYSNIISLASAVKDMTVVISPNPFKGQMELVVNSAAASTAMIEMMDLNSHVVLKQTTSLNKGTNSILLNDLSNLASGIYFLHLKTDQTVQTFKLIKE